MRIIHETEIGMNALLDEMVRVLADGGVVAHPTDTCYGLACDIFDVPAVAKIARIKGTDPDKPLSIIIDSLESLPDYAVISADQRELLQGYLPGPYTLIVPKKRSLPYQPQHPTLGIRIPDFHLARELVKRFGGAVTTTSANITGHPVLYSAQDVVREFQDREFQPDLIVDIGPMSQNPPSRILDMTGDAPKWIR